MLFDMIVEQPENNQFIIVEQVTRNQKMTT